MWNKLGEDDCPEYIQVWVDFTAKVIVWLRRHI